jgi:hypothetical protein
VSGTAGNPITFDAYGTGAKPKFWGSEILINSAFEWVSGTTYQIAFTAEVFSVLADQEFMLGDTPVLTIQSVADVNSRSNSWFWSADILYVNTGSHDPRADGRVYSAVVRDDVISVQYRQNLVFRNLAVDETARYDAGYGVRTFRSENIVMEDCDAFRCGKHHFGVINTSGFIGRRLYGAYAMPAQGSGGASTFVPFSDDTVQDTTSEWYDCVAEHMEDAYTEKSYPAFVTHGPGIGSVLISNMTSYGAGIGTGDNTTIIGGRIVDAGLTVNSKGFVQGMHISGNNGSISINGDGNLIENCVVAGSKGQNSFNAAVICDGTSNTLRFCTVVLSPGVESWDTCLAFRTGNEHTRLYGNVMQAKERVFQMWNRSLNADDIDYAAHNFYNTGAQFKDNGTVLSFSQWQALGYDSTSSAGDPSFVNLGGYDLHLDEGSSCIDAVPGMTPAIDHDGLARPLDGDTNDLAMADIGAYEFAHATGDTDGDSMSDMDEFLADTDATDPNSILAFTGIHSQNNDIEISWTGGREASQIIEFSTNLTLSGSWEAIYTNNAPTALSNALLNVPVTQMGAFRLKAFR